MRMQVECREPPEFPAKAPAAMIGSLLTQWTIRLALACLAVYFGGRLLTSTLKRDWKFATLRWIWTVGCALFIAHVVCAFQFTHHWSHAHAWEHTARETERLMGYSFGDGIYFSYFFLLVWVADVVCLWLAVSRPIWLVGTAYLFMFFIAFNGAIVFEDGPTRPAGIVISLLLIPVVVLFVLRISNTLLRKRAFAKTAAELET